jgi:hypothetical protein
MKTRIVLFSLFAAMLILSACPYQSAVPIDVPNKKVNKNLLGKWIKDSEKDQPNPEYYVIKPFDELKYNIVKFEYQTSDSSYSETKYITHLSYIDDYVFMNMQKDGEGDFYLYRLDMSSDEFTLYEVTDNIDEKFTSSDELKAFVARYMKLSFFYNKDEVKYTRSK